MKMLTKITIQIGVEKLTSLAGMERGIECKITILIWQEANIEIDQLEVYKCHSSNSTQERAAETPIDLPGKRR